MSQAAGNESVAKNNERLFKMYEKNLKVPSIKEYADTVVKLATWLGDSKAYYTAARPNVCIVFSMVTLPLIYLSFKIVMLLMVRSSQ
jgi:hypothetical protein